MDIHINLQPKGERLEVWVRGELDDHSGRKLRDVVEDVITDPDVRTVVLDLSGVSFMDSRGLGQLLGACASIEGANRRAFVAEPSIHAQRVLESAGVAERFREP